MPYSITLAKENFKFSGTHFTVLSENTAERLHGHNYYVQIEIAFDKLEKSDLGLSFDFNLIKPIVKRLCDELDEYVLLPSQSPFVNIREEGMQCLVEFQKRKYSFPKNEVRILPLTNVTSEELARHLADNIVKELANSIQFRELKVRVEESRGQGAAYSIKN